MILDSPCGSNKEIYSSLKLMSLIRNADSSIDCHNSKLIFMVLHFGEFSRNLEGKLTSWSQHDGLNFACSEQVIFSKILYGWKTEGKSFSRAG